MDCPNCKNAMIVLQLDEVEIDYCEYCNGIWLDSGELEILLADAESAENFLKSFNTFEASKEKPRRCPICSKKMEKVLAGTEEKKILLDRCKRSHGLWFDKGELNEVLDNARLDEDHRIKQLLKEIFKAELQE